MSDPTETLLLLIDQEAEAAAHEIRDRVFSTFRELPWTSEHRQQLQPLIRREIDLFIQRLLASFDNVGGILPTGVLGYEIRAVLDDEAWTVVDVRTDEDDYADMWLAYLFRKQEGNAGTGQEGRP